MKQASYPERDHAFGQSILSLRSAIGLTQSGLADYLGISRRAVGDWEVGSSYPKAEHLKLLIALAVTHRAFPPGRVAEAVRTLWQAAHQKVLLDEQWLVDLLAPKSYRETGADHEPASLTNRSQTTAGDRAVIGLPFQPTPFIGRVAEVNQLARLLSDPRCRLLTLVGPGGIGKTRLAIEVAARQSAAYSDGVAFVALGSVGTPDQVVSALGEALGLSFAGQPDPAAYLLGALRERHMLLVLDNFEHLITGSDLVNDLLARAPRVTLLVTSRERLNLQAEWLFDVGGLVYPDAHTLLGTQHRLQLADYSAIQLFVQRATQVQPTLTLTEATLTTIGRICQHLAGMPLAIELAAAGMRTLSVDDIEQQIRSNLDVLTTTRRDVPARHRSLRAVFEHSWSLLSEPEQVLLSRLAVFRGSYTAAAAEQVAGATPPSLTALVDKSLVRLVGGEAPAADNAQAESRFILLEPIREYALEKLSARGETQALQRAYAAYYLALAEAAAVQWDTLTVDAAIRQLNQEHDNLRAVLRWACDGGDHAIGLQVGAALWRFWRGRGHISEGRAWLASLLAQQDAPAGAMVLAARLRALNGAAWLASDQHDFQQAAQLFEQSLALRRAQGETADDTNLLLNAALQARAVGQYRRATALLEDALALHRATGNRGSLNSGGLGQSLYQLGLVLREQGDLVRARDLFEECVQLHRDIQDREGMTVGLMGLGDVARDQGDTAGVRTYCERSLAMARELGMQWAIGFSLNNLALATYLEGDLAHALMLAGESAALFRELQADGSLAETLVTLGLIALAQGDSAATHEALIEALRLAWAVGPRLLVAGALEGLAGLESHVGQATQVVRLLGASAALRARMGTPVRRADQPTVERALAVAQSTLGAKAFADLWSQAAQTPLDQVLNAVLNPSPARYGDEQPALAPVPSRQPPAPPAVTAPDRSRHAPGPSAGAQRADWGDALAVPAFYGREWEIDLLTQWVIGERCRVVSVLGMGGIGKSALAVSFMHRASGDFEVVIGRSLRDAPDCDALVDDWLQVLAPGPLVQTPGGFERRLSLLLEYMRGQRTLLVLDNLETVLEEGNSAGHIRAGYEGYAQLLRRVAETQHQSCLLLTSREKPGDLVPLEGNQSPVRALRLARLDGEACDRLLVEKGIGGTKLERARLIQAYGGNPLALKIVAQTIVDLFAGETAAFLEQGEIIFGGIRELLSQQFTRLSAVEQRVLLWLAILREPAGLDELLASLATPVPRAQLLEAVEALRRRSLIERGQKQGTFTLQSVVLEYVTARLITEAADEIRAGRLVHMVEHGFDLAQAPEYVQQIHERLILAPLLACVRGAYPQPAALEERLLALLAALGMRSDAEQGYGPANLIALVRLHRGQLRGLDMSRLVLRGVHLQDVDMQDASLAGAMIQESVFTETFDALTAVAISKDGAYWAAASRRGEIRIWEANGQALTLRRAWRAHPNMIYHLAFSPDGRSLASGGWDGAVKLWDVAGGSLRWSGRHASHINSTSFSPDGRILSSSGSDATVRLWDAPSGRPLQTLSHPSPASGAGVTWSPDGRLLATGDQEGTIRLWEVDPAQPSSPATCVRAIAAHTAWVDGLAFSPAGDILASASFDGMVKLWDIATGNLQQTLTGHTNRVLRVAWSPDGRTLASSSFDQTAWLWDVEQAAYRAVLRGHRAAVVGLAFTPDSHRLLSGSEDGTLQVWDVANGQCLRVIHGYASSVYDVDWSPDGAQLVSGGSDELVTIWDTTGGTPPRPLHGHGGVVIEVSWSSDGRWLASSEWDNAIRLWDSSSGECVRILRHQEDDGNFFDGLAWRPGSQQLASGTYRHGALVWDATHLRQAWAGQELPIWIRHVAWSTDGRRLAGGDDDGNVYVWDAADGRLLRRLAGHHGTISSLTWSPGGMLLASGSCHQDDGELFIWDIPRGVRQRVIAGHPAVVNGVAWGATEALLVSGDGDGTLRWWDAQNGALIRALPAHQGAVQSLKRSPDGGRLGKLRRRWRHSAMDLRSGQHLQTLRRDRPYERLDITGIRGLSDAQKATLLTLGAIEGRGHSTSSQFLPTATSARNATLSE